MNSVHQFIEQQTRACKWKIFENVMNRLRCVDTDEYKNIYPDENPELDNTVDSPIFACKFAQKQGEQHMLALANEDGKVAVHNTINSVPRVGKQIHHNAVFDLAWMFNQMKIVTVSGDHTARLLDVSASELREERMFSGHSRSVKTLAIKQNDTSTFATGSRDGNILVWDTRSTSNIMFISNPDKVIMSAHCSKFTTPSKRKSYVQTHYLSGADSVTGLVFQDNDTLISCSAGDGVIKLWDLRKTYKVNKREPYPKFTIPYSGSIANCGFSSLILDQECVKLYASCLDNVIYCYNVLSYDQNPVMKYSGHENNTFYIKSCLSSDGHYLLSGSSDHNAYIWNTENSEPIVKLTGHTAEVTCVAWYQHYDTTLVTCSDDYRHKIWRIGPEMLPDNWEIYGRGLAQKITSKRCLDDVTTASERKKSKSCPFCDFSTDKHCENCNSNAGNSKRLAVDYLDCESKRLHTEDDSKRLFETLYPNNRQYPRSVSYDYIPVKRAKFDLGESSKKTHEEEESNCGGATPKSSFKFREKSPETFSPTSNLPNFNVDGCAPHLNYSPQKKIDKDWLTKIRVEKSLMREMRELANSPTPPKMMKLSNPSPKSRSLKKHGKGASGHCASTQSPLLKFFRVTNNSIMKDSQCVSKISLTQIPQ